MYCPTCGNELAEGTEFCPVCGMDLKGYNKNDGKMNVEKSMDILQAVSLARQGREEGFNYLYESTYRNNYYMALKYMKNQQDAMDVLQTAYMRAFSRLDLLRDEGKFAGWMSTIVANTAKNMLQRKNPVLFTDMAPENDDSEAMELQLVDESEEYQPEAAYSKQETQMLVHELIDSLSEEQRMCILMFYIEGQSVNEIAEILECSKNTVLSRLNYGRKNIKAKAEELQKKGYKLYSGAPIAFVIYLLNSEAKQFVASGAAEIAGGVGAGASIGAKVGAVISGGTGAGATISGGVQNLATNKTGGAQKLAGQVGNQAIVNAGKDIAGQVVKTAVKKKFIQTVAGKITASVVGIALAGGITGGIIYYNHAEKDKSDTSKKKKQIEASANEQVDVTETAEATTTEITTEAITEITTEVTTEEVVDESYKDAYLEVLKENKEAILDYDWQYPGEYDTATNKVVRGESLPVAICDINGDNVPELIFASETEGQADSNAELHIWSYEDNKAKEIYTDSSLHASVASGTNYYVFQSGDNGDLYSYSANGDESYWYTYTQYGFDNDGMIIKIHKWSLHSRPNDDYSETLYSYTLDGNDITEKEYNDKIDEINKNMKTLIIHNIYVEEYMNNVEKEYMTYEEAVNWLKNKKTSQESGAKTLTVDLPDDLPDAFSFSSGAGAWSTGVVIYPDGTFEGSYHDSDMGDSGDGYKSTVYYCSFSGKFTNIKKVDDYTYSMELESITTADEEGIETIEDEVRYVASYPYGMDAGKEFLLYCPGATISELPEDFINWVSMVWSYGNNEPPKTLQFYGLYNVEKGYGFYSWADN
jgi:RNA polymerase sigma factor (sigma-70 family)